MVILSTFLVLLFSLLLTHSTLHCHFRLNNELTQVDGARSGSTWNQPAKGPMVQLLLPSSETRRWRDSRIGKIVVLWIVSSDDQIFALPQMSPSRRLPSSSFFFTRQGHRGASRCHQRRPGNAPQRGRAPTCRRPGSNPGGCAPQLGVAPTELRSVCTVAVYILGRI